MQRSTFQTNLWKLASAFSVEITPDKAEVYWEDLCDLPDDIFAVACTRARREWDKPFALPPIATLLRYATEAAQASGTIVSGETAWAAFCTRVLSRYSFGVTKSFDWPDELTREVVREHLGIGSAAVHTLALIEHDIERDKYRRRFIQEYDARRKTAQAVERAEVAIDAPKLRALDSGTEVAD